MASLAVDSWSLGCVASFCRLGCPPFFGDKYVFGSYDLSLIALLSSSFSCRDQVERQIRLKFKLDMDGRAEGPHVFFEESLREEELVSTGQESAELVQAFRDFISAALVLDPRHRPSYPHLAKHPFFACPSKPGFSPFSFHLGEPVSLPRGAKRTAGKGEDSEWGRRQFSHIWYINSSFSYVKV